MSQTSRTIHLASPDATCRLAERLGATLAAGDVLLLSGPVGAGKSHFARCLIRSLLRTPEDIPSPTFTLVQTYETSAGELWHADLYRLSDGGEIEELGLAEAFDTAIALVEWPDRLPEPPAQALSIAFAPLDDPEARNATLTWTDPRWDPRLEGLDA
ncbi:tRNA (adenosine(37)-N6)-threonylcarbamoyltransferase complex ATPase subunit type 1 TsaE [Mesobacterium pallidum]|uniref:tRNA (adenosine(37)-N6)-threonylcarbamoyltransferase complex ATPase subunit type 1 TsaE n=1 Tax=Mesobacterium pallidum TaxID=2872037 RepID=UPI001EE37BBB|nr:tRNA (adenosine(37)-N6)-threonylcarbamoyltransferase complex ATPase subunit type 1 TsaE [Mesobacterium pallidum]